MTLSERIAANQCLVRDCARRRAPDAQVCDDDLRELWANRLDRQPDGTFSRRRVLTARDETGWVRAA